MMISVLFPPGCYGTFLSKCIYEFSELTTFSVSSFEFTQTGSSHNFRHNATARKKIQSMHLETYQLNTNTVVVLPCCAHELDYFNNQFAKQELRNLVSYISNQFLVEEISTKLSTHWNYFDGLSIQTPPWILREWCSFWLNDCLTTSYCRTKYTAVPNCCILNTSELFDSFVITIHRILDSLELTCCLSDDLIEKIGVDFAKYQQFHNSQLNCNQWIDAVLHSRRDMSIDLKTIFDEAYIQQQLRMLGWEIKCNELNSFPCSSLIMKNLIYKT